MSLRSPFPLVQRYALLGHCAGAALLAEADRHIAADAEAARLLVRPGARVATDVQTRMADGGLRIKSVLWSVAAPCGPSPGLPSRTLICGPDGARWFDLAEDPTLDFGGLLERDGTRVLAYVPGRRATLRRLVDGKPVIRKIKKRERLAEAISRHRAVSRAVAGGDVPMPALIGTGADYDLSFCPGAPLTGPEPADEILARLGRIVAELHASPVQGMAAVEREPPALGWLRGALPGLAARWDGLAACLSEEPGGIAPCHGDLTLGQMLVDPAMGDRGVTLLDFDRSGAGDPADDLAMLLESLQEAGFHDNLGAEHAVLEGYSERLPLPADLPRARVRAGLERLRHCIRKGIAPTRWIMATLERAEAGGKA